MRILVWATTFGADLWSFTKYADQRSDTTVKVVMDDPDTFLQQGIADLFPLTADFIKRRWYHYLIGVPGFSPDVTLMDNRTPFFRTSPAALMLWHGFGWKGPDSESDMWWLHHSLWRTWGDARKPNDRFRWQCFGPWDKEHRTNISGFHPSNCRILGAASHDDLRTPLDRSLAQPYYPFDLTARPTVLIAPTWHYGEVFAHWGTDEVLFERLLTHLHDRGTNVILRLHDSYRFSKEYRALLDGLVQRHSHVMLKFKDQAPDNYLDLQVADVLITNYSSIANLFYATRRPTIHVYPVRHADEAFLQRRYTVTGVRTSRVEKARYTWKLPPEDNGGLVARSFDALLQHIDRSLDDPHCCEEAAHDFLDRHMLGADGRTCERIWQTLDELTRR